MEIKNLWPTEVMFGTMPEDMCQTITHELLTSEIDFTVGGLSNNFISDRDDLVEYTKFMKEYVPNVLNEYTTQVYNYDLNPANCKIKSWVNNGAGKYSLGFHNHSGAQLSAVFYFLVDPGDQSGGRISLHDPRFNANRGTITPFRYKHDDYSFTPKSGEFVIFPSYLYHSVSTFHGTIRLMAPVDVFIVD